MTISSTSAPLLGQVFAGRYELVRHIARGGMGDVYEAQDRLLRRQVAVKVYRATALADRSRFDAEVHTLAALSHPGLVQVYDAGEHGGDGYVVLELVDGPTLRSILAARAKLPPREAGALGAAMADALAYVHAAGVVHRDVTPSNILCGSDGRPRLADFGIVRLLDTTRVTAVATTIGTAAYMAPEQVEGRDVTPAADVYALGLVLLEALTGRTAFSGAGHEVALARLVRDPDTETDVPISWQPVLREMTARDPGDRPTAAAASERLAAIAADASAAVPVPVSVAASGFSGDASVDGHAVTQAVASVGGGTTVMPAIHHPEPPAIRGHAAARAAGAAIARSRRALWVAAAVITVVVLAVVAAGSEGGIEVPTETTEPAAVTVATTAPTTTVLPTTTEPPREGKGKGRGNGND